VQRISSILNQVGFAAFAKIQHDPEQSGLYLLKGVRVLSFLAYPVLWGMSSIATELVIVVLGPKWDLAILPLQILTLVVVLRVISVILGAAVDALGRADVTLANILVANAIMLPAFAIGSVWGLTGLSLVWGLVSPIVTLFNWMRLVTVVKLRVREIVSAMLPSMFCAAGMYCVVFLARRYITHEHQGVMDLLTLISAGVASYSLFSLAFNTKGCKEIVELRKR
jgi:teichuronic acid exporter